tara:strand:+ start:245 stop:514 length:270 start_codon:yes stop_codon:yes gene_type:complete
MNIELQQDIGIAVVTFTENHKRSIAAGDHNYFEYWLNTETELLATLQDVFVRHKNKHTFKEMIFFSLVIGIAVKGTMDDLHRFDKENEE